MTWLFSKAMMEAYGSSHSLPAQGGGSLAGNCSDGEQFAQLNVMPTPHKFWRNDKTIESSDLSRFGLTLKLLTEDHGAAMLTAYLADSHAKTSASSAEFTGRAPASKALAVDYGSIRNASFAKLMPDLSGWRTAQCSLFEDLELYLQTWPSWGLMRNGECWEVQTAMEITTGKESGYWATPTATDGKGAPLLTTILRRSAVSSRGVRLPEQIAKHLGIDLTTKLNPEWSEQLMNWPIGWTDLRPLEMDKFQSWLEQHGASYVVDP